MWAIRCHSLNPSLSRQSFLTTRYPTGLSMHRNLRRNSSHHRQVYRQMRPVGWPSLCSLEHLSNRRVSDRSDLISLKPCSQETPTRESSSALLGRPPWSSDRSQINSTETVKMMVDGRKRRIYSNFDDLNRMLLTDYLVGTWPFSLKNDEIGRSQTALRWSVKSENRQKFVGEMSKLGYI